jgi:site-specific recombinase XerD
MKGKKYGFLLDEPSVKRWYDNMARGSLVTADTSLRRLGVLCGNFKKTPKELALMNEEELGNLLMDYVSSMEKNGYAGNYISQYVKAIKSWLNFNHKELKIRIKIKGVNDTPSLKNERTPTREELRSILLSSDKKARVAAVLMAHSGFRVEVLGNYTGDDGIRVMDFPEMEIKDGEIKFARFPTMLTVRKELSKTKHQYITFLGEEGCGYLRDYLGERLRAGEKINPESPIITPKIAKKSFIRSINIGDILRKAIRKAGLHWRPYVLRSYFDTQLMLAESKGLVLRDYRTFWMGHKGDIENRYTTNRNRLSDEVIEDMRESYSKALPFLETVNKPTENIEKIKDEFRKQLLLVSGYRQEEVEKMPYPTMSDDAFQATIRQRLLGAMVSNGNKQKVVNADDIEDCLSNGWEFVSNIPGDRAVMKLPF